MFYKDDRLALFIDGSNLYAAGKAPLVIVTGAAIRGLQQGGVGEAGYNAPSSHQRLYHDIQKITSSNP